MKKILIILILILISGCNQMTLDSTVICDDGRKVSMGEGCIPNDGKNYFEENMKLECETDNDCVPSTCCHPTKCVSKDKAPNCEGIICTMECKSGTLDCGQGECLCMNTNCETILK